MLVLVNSIHSLNSTPMFSNLYVNTRLDPQARLLKYMFGVLHIAPKVVGKQTLKETVIRHDNNSKSGNETV